MLEFHPYHLLRTRGGLEITPVLEDGDKKGDKAAAVDQGSFLDKLGFSKRKVG